MPVSDRFKTLNLISSFMLRLCKRYEETIAFQELIRHPTMRSGQPLPPIGHLAYLVVITD